jgi:hypothetical protein
MLPETWLSLYLSWTNIPPTSFFGSLVPLLQEEYGSYHSLAKEWIEVNRVELQEQWHRPPIPSFQCWKKTLSPQHPFCSLLFCCRKWEETGRRNHCDLIIYKSSSYSGFKLCSVETQEQAERVLILLVRHFNIIHGIPWEDLPCPRYPIIWIVIC